MKTLKLRALKLDAGELLTRVQMKNVRGGYEGCCAHTAGWSSYSCGYPSASAANSAAAYAAEYHNVQTFYCCQSC